jgi:hypothetical protein
VPTSGIYLCGVWRWAMPAALLVRRPPGELLSLPLPACRGEPAALPQLGAVVL